jgi:hypothetical protein
MKKIIFTIAIAFMAIITNVSAQAPNIKMNESGHNFGQIEEGPEYKHTFTFTNTGDAPLIVNNVVTPCGCTTPTFTKDPVLPGKSGEIVLSYNSAGRLGSFDKTCTVLTNLGAGKDVYLNIKGEVKEKGTTVTKPVETKITTLTSPDGKTKLDVEEPVKKATKKSKRAKKTASK